MKVQGKKKVSPRHVFVSPHYDDAVFSAGGFLLSLLKEGKEILLVTVFSEEKGEQLSPDCLNYLNRCGFKKVLDFDRARKMENRQLGKYLDIKTLDLGFVDAAFRVKETALLYPDFDDRGLFSGEIFPAEETLTGQIADKLRKIVSPDDILYGPLGIGGHVDHVLTEKALQLLENRKYAWADVPYVFKHEEQSCLKKETAIVFNGERESKKKLIGFYRTQKDFFSLDEEEISREYLIKLN